MKVLLVTLDFYPKTGGAAEYYLNLCKELKEVAVLTDGAADKMEFGL